jgi:hypothetical protein
MRSPRRGSWPEVRPDASPWRHCAQIAGVQDPVTDTIVFSAPCGSLEESDWASQLFAVQPDGSGLRQLTAARGCVVDSDDAPSCRLSAHGRYAIFQMAEVAVPRELFGGILDRIARLRPRDLAPC